MAADNEGGNRFGYVPAVGTSGIVTGVSYQLTMDRLPGTSRTVVGVDRNGSALQATVDYREAGPASRTTTIVGSSISAAADGVYVGGRCCGVLKISDPLGTAVQTVVAGAGRSVGFIRADRQTRTAVAALQSENYGEVYLRSGALAPWQSILTPSREIANVVEVIVAAPTAAPTPTPTRQPTPLPTLTPLPRSSVPNYTTSYYILDTQAKVMFSMGCRARSNGEQGIVILAFGSPRNNGTATRPRYGTRLLFPPKPFVSTQVIAQAVYHFARGYLSQSCVESGNPTRPNLVLVVGTSNSRICENDRCRCVISSDSRPSEANCDRPNPTIVNWIDNPALTRNHGQAWREMIVAINDQLRTSRYWPLVRAAGGYDAEFGAPAWNSAGTMEWARGFTQQPGKVKNDPNSRNPVFLYNFGSCEDCPRKQTYLSRTSAQKDRLDQVYQLSWGLPYTRPLPQIYFAPYAQEWFNVRRYAQERYREQMDIVGVVTGCRDVLRAASASPATGCSFSDPRHWSEYPVGSPRTTLPPTQGWLALYETLNAPTTPDGTRNRYQQRVLSWVTDITRTYQVPR